MKRITIIILIFSIIGLIFFIWFFSDRKSDEGIITEVKTGEFVISVNTSGELDSKTSTNINGPSGVRSLGIYQNLKLNDIIEEGTLVDSGDYIASIDQTPLLNTMKDINSNLEKLEAKINQSKLDSALTLRADRDNLVNLKFNISELEIELKNSKYESPVTKEKLRISVDKAKRQFNQALKNYQLKRKREVNTVRTSVIDYQKELAKKERFLHVLKEFRITAPQSGMLIYAKSWGGRKIKTGSEISMWNPVVAKLPDLSQMIVKTYVNEIDISHIKINQTVEIGVDAFPEKKLFGKVTSVANIGEEMQGTSAHVFEVIIEIDDTDGDLRPAMTTKNSIIIETLDSVNYIPIECLNTTDSITYVYCKNKKQEVKAGKSNQDEIVIIEGLKGHEKIYMVPPEDANKWSLNTLK